MNQDIQKEMAVRVILDPVDPSHTYPLQRPKDNDRCSHTEPISQPLDKTVYDLLDRNLIL